MVEEFRKAPVENMDEVIYVVNGTYRLLEFLVSAPQRPAVGLPEEWLSFGLCVSANRADTH